MNSNPATPNNGDRPRNSLDNLVVAITGAGSGIGRACARAYATKGASVAVSDIDLSSAKNVTHEIESAGGTAAAWALDVTDRASIESAISSMLSELGRIDIWHNNAGVSSMNRFVDLSDRDWDTNMNVNARGTFYCSQAVTRYFIDNDVPGRIINTVSMAGQRGNAPFLAHYVASKFAVIGLTQAMAGELARYGITVNSICPGYVATSMQDREAEWEAKLRGISADGVRQMYVADTPLGRLQTPDDVAATAVFLASPESSFITGQAIHTNGGSFMN